MELLIPEVVDSTTSKDVQTTMKKLRHPIDDCNLAIADNSAALKAAANIEITALRQEAAK